MGRWHTPCRAGCTVREVVKERECYAMELVNTADVRTMTRDGEKTGVGSREEDKKTKLDARGGEAGASLR